MKNQSQFYRNTPIPHRTKNGNPMTYYVVDEDGNHTVTTREICLFRNDDISDGQPSQRWFVDEESGMVVRLPRTEESETLARYNMQYIWREEKRRERNYSCIYKNTDKCSGWETAADGTKDCDHCGRRNISRIVELDRPIETDESSGELTVAHSLAAANDIASAVEDSALLETLHAALATLLTEEQRKLILDNFWDEKSERAIARELGIKSNKSVTKRKQKILDILRNHEALKKFFE